MKLRQLASLSLLLLSLLIASCGDDDRPFDPGNQNPATGDPTDPTSSTGRQVCQEGFAGIYPCNGYDLMSNLNLAQLNAGEVANDIWGWTDPENNKEYAIVGVSRGVNFIDISNPIEPKIVGRLATATAASTWRDIKVYQNHAFIVSEAGGHGMQVFDLTRLRNADDTIQMFDADVLYQEFGNAHNIVINEDTGYAYAVGTSSFAGGPHFINIQDPKNPVFEGGFAEGTYTHDAQVVTYNGPDTDYQGRELFIGCNETEIAIIDVTDKSAPTIISQVAYSSVAFTHQGWLTEDHTYFIANDELDESSFGFNTRSLLFDFTDLDNPIFTGTYTGPTEAIDHNYYTKGNELWISNYTAGVRVVSLSDIATNSLTEIASFDTFPDNNNTGFGGVWSVYPYFASGNIIVSDMNNGFFVIRKTGS